MDVSMAPGVKLNPGVSHSADPAGAASPRISGSTATQTSAGSTYFPKSCLSCTKPLEFPCAAPSEQSWAGSSWDVQFRMDFPGQIPVGRAQGASLNLHQLNKEREFIHTSHSNSSLWLTSPGLFHAPTTTKTQLDLQSSILIHPHPSSALICVPRVSFPCWTILKLPITPTRWDQPLW